MMLSKRTQVFSVSMNSFTVDIPPFQRNIDNNHIQSLYETAMTEINRGTAPAFPSICVARYPVVVNNQSHLKFFIIDGQHRYRVYEMLHANGYIFDIDISVIFCDSQDEAEFRYSLFNRRMEHSTVELESPSLITNLDRQVKDYMISNPNIFSITDRYTRPKIKSSKFYDRYMISQLRNRVRSLQDFKDYLNINNERMKELFTRDRNQLIILDVNEAMYNRAVRENNYLGLDKELRWLV